MKDIILNIAERGLDEFWFYMAPQMLHEIYQPRLSKTQIDFNCRNLELIGHIFNFEREKGSAIKGCFQCGDNGYRIRFG